MPTYVYACTECGHRFEAVQSFADDSLTECPECEGRLRKVFNSVGVVFKGSGFYKTDSRSSGSATSPATATALPPAAAIRSATFCATSCFRSAAMTVAPAAARSSAIASPMPEPAPVTRAVLP